VQFALRVNRRRYSTIYFLISMLLRFMMQRKKKFNRPINHYAKWKYVLLVTVCVVLAVSALPSWFGEKPAINIALKENSKGYQLVREVKATLDANGVPTETIVHRDEDITVTFTNEQAQSRAKALLTEKLSLGPLLTYSYRSVAPEWLSQLGFQPIKLGLDLRGGVQFLLDVDVTQALAEQQTLLIDDLKQNLLENGVLGARINADGNETVTVLVRQSNDIKTVRALLEGTKTDWQIREHSQSITLTRTNESIKQFQALTMEQNMKIMRQRIQELGITEAMVQRQGSNGIRIELPGVQDPALAKRVIGATASLAFYQVENNTSQHKATLSVMDENGRDIALIKKPVMTGEYITNARVGFDEMHRPEVDISLNHAGGKIMHDFSKQHLGKPMATVYREYGLDDKGHIRRSEKIISIATIQSTLGSHFRITGSGGIEQAQQLALLLRAGSLTAPVTIVEERTIGASLGAENIENGFAALGLGLGLTLTFMAMWYRRLGWIANTSLVLNMTSLLGLIALIPGAILTLPGIAGLVLTVGMAVDTNVLIFERIRDKLREGRTFSQAIDTGFSSALSTILDANITTLITSVILYCVGTGPIKGFALTLGLGLLTSMFTGIFVSRALINLIWGKDMRREVRI
jgi:preprotein translocase subunit SecD